MPRRDKTADNEEVVVAGGPEDANPADPANAGGETEAKPKSSVNDLPLGNRTTRTGAAATVIQGPRGKRVFTAGGDKGAKIRELLETKPDMPRKEIAAMVGCSQSRVAEVARVLGLASARQPRAEEPAGEAEAPAEAATS